MPPTMENSVFSSRVCSSSPRHAKNASIILVGMRGVGKTTLARIASKALGWEAIDADTIFAAHVKQDIYSYISTHGWDSFRNKESQLLNALLDRYPTNKVIACGGGVVERAENRELLKEFGQSRGPVIHVMREKDLVLRYLEENCAMFPPYLRITAAEAWDRRESYYNDISSHEFVSLTVFSTSGNLSASNPSTTSILLKPVESAFLRLLKFIHGIDTNHVLISPTAGLHTLPPRAYFLPLKFPDLSTVFSPPRHSDLPILYTVRTKSQGGLYPDLTDERARAGMYRLIVLAFKLACEYVDLGLSMPQEMFTSLVSQRGYSRVIGSWYDWNGSISWTGPETKAIYERAVNLGVSVVKIVNTAKRLEDNLSLRTFVESVLTKPVPILAINMGPEGKMSRVLNPILSPVTHPLLPSPTSPGQLSYAEAQQILYLTGLLPQRSFYLFGTPIAHSLLPHLHSAAFQLLKLPHTFTPISTTKFNLEEFEDAIISADFGGAALTTPHKLSAMALCKRVSHHARLIGAINMLIPCHSPGFGNATHIVGENTDWVAIYTCLTRKINTSLNGPTCRTTALILGAGDTARAAIYALYQIGVSHILLWNRTRDKAVSLAREMRERLEGADASGTAVRIGVLTGVSREDVKRGVAEMTRTMVANAYLAGWLEMPTLIISTIPASRIEGEDDGRVGDIPDVGLRADVLELSAAGGVAVELVYQPRMTPLLRIVEEVNQRATKISAMTKNPSSGINGIVHAHALPFSGERVMSAVKVEMDDYDNLSSLSHTRPLGNHLPHPQLNSSSTYENSTRALAAPWSTVEGIEVLLELGYEQTRLWTGRRAPKKFRIRGKIWQVGSTFMV
ncbi:type I 3-dehydroquinase-domain-containing protein [Cantharellus anzutake]|uniref:type I 3-dehydroquinase-domain-containing protein n=1 Tax=Cantharellus anzutake TaxID=1750568 RepID=UPI001902ED59|nr:type I 3-dehydroquinase-domain-containing protein [Cantharellus anzutake]KAF8329154.1 type I 3-dehydroquinase-domain-containing protein [Cantharellus anzutake]